MNSRQRKICCVLMTGLTLAIMAIIFLLSAQPGEGSYALSRQVTAKVSGSAVNRMMPMWFNAANVHANIRKWAHVYLYAALGASMAVTVDLYWKGTVRNRALLCFLISTAACVLYAAADELHQILVPGRAGMLQDVGVDAMGFLPAILCAELLLALHRRRKAGKGKRPVP